MRLINTTTLALEEFTEQDIPPYAILSHTWSQNEVSLQEMLETTQEELEEKEGYHKISGFCDYARRRGFSHGWADVCCVCSYCSNTRSDLIGRVSSHK